MTNPHLYAYDLITKYRETEFRILFRNYFRQSNRANGELMVVGDYPLSVNRWAHPTPSYLAPGLGSTPGYVLTIYGSPTLTQGRLWK